jgi:DNA-binding helix-hairpin-helix protein with protein kinase domain
MSGGPSRTDIVDSQGKPISLGAVLGKGGEGVVFEVKQTTSTVAKVYHKPLSPERADKIRAMTRMRTEALAKLTSWPVDLLTTRNAQPIGLLMPKIADRKNVHHLYGPKSRIQDFPRADWRFLVHAATNVARAFAVVHDANCVIGDVNHGSIMVADDATIRLIDCDSFQVCTPTRKFLCDVGIETFTPPELQGLPFKGVTRTPNFDNFGLAVMVFHLLFMGRHPFAGRYLDAGEMPIARAIKECRFPYSFNHKAKRMDPPPGTPPLSFVGAEVAMLFEHAFSQVATKAGRPTARDWAAALQKLELESKQCGLNKGHWYPLHSSTCPWCQMEGQGANPLFPFVVPFAQSRSGAAVDVEGLWRQLQVLPSLGEAPSIPVPQAKPSPAAIQAGPPSKLAQPTALAAAILVFAGGTFMVPVLFWIFGFAAIFAYNLVSEKLSNTQDVSRFRLAVTAAEGQFNQANAEWQRRASDASFRQAQSEFQALRAVFVEIPAKRIRALDQLKRDQRQLQLERFLDGFEIDSARINGIGPGRKRTLESYGIETAADVVERRLEAVPGFGPKMIARLMSWRRTIEAKFVFNPSRGIDPRDTAKVEQEILAFRTKTELSLKEKHKEALQAHARIQAVRQTQRQNMERLQAAVAQARADIEYVKG